MSGIVRGEQLYESQNLSRRVEISTGTTSEGQEVIIKTIHFADASEIASYQNTLLNIRDLKHPHICEHREPKRTENVLEIVMEPLSMSLQNSLSFYDTCPWGEEALLINFQGLVGALVLAEGKEGTGLFKLVSFGPSVKSVDDYRAQVSAQEVRYHSPGLRQFLAEPESRQMGRFYPFKADVWALGICLLQLLFIGPNEAELAEALDTDYTVVTSVLENLDNIPEVRWLLSHMLIFDEDQRPSFVDLNKMICVRSGYCPECFRSLENKSSDLCNACQLKRQPGPSSQRPDIPSTNPLFQPSANKHNPPGETHGSQPPMNRGKLGVPEPQAQYGNVAGIAPHDSVNGGKPEAPIQMPQYPDAPGRNVQAPVQIPRQTPVQIPGQVPVQIPGQAPRQSPVQIPVQTSSQIDAQAPVNIPDQAHDQFQIQIPGDMPRASTGQDLESKVGVPIMGGVPATDPRPQVPGSGPQRRPIAEESKQKTNFPVQMTSKLGRLPPEMSSQNAKEPGPPEPSPYVAPTSVDQPKKRYIIIKSQQPLSSPIPKKCLKCNNMMTKVGEGLNEVCKKCHIDASIGQILKTEEPVVRPQPPVEPRREMQAYPQPQSQNLDQSVRKPGPVNAAPDQRQAQSGRLAPNPRLDDVGRGARQPLVPSSGGYSGGSHSRGGYSGGGYSGGSVTCLSCGQSFRPQHRISHEDFRHDEENFCSENCMETYALLVSQFDMGPDSEIVVEAFQDEGGEGVKCMECTGPLRANAVPLPCDPQNHQFCSNTCASVFLQNATQPSGDLSRALCPKCSKQIPAELSMTWLSPAQASQMPSALMQKPGLRPGQVSAQGWNSGFPQKLGVGSGVPGQVVRPEPGQISGNIPAQKPGSSTNPSETAPEEKNEGATDPKQGVQKNTCVCGNTEVAMQLSCHHVLCDRCQAQHQGPGGLECPICHSVTALKI